MRSLRKRLFGSLPTRKNKTVNQKKRAKAFHLKRELINKGELKDDLK